MDPSIETTGFGYIVIGDTRYENDVLIRLSGEVKKRKKKLSKKVYGTSHTMSEGEAKHIYEKGATWLIIGNGQYGRLTLSDEARVYFEEQGCRVYIYPTPEAINHWNKAEGAVIGLFHLTC